MRAVIAVFLTLAANVAAASAATSLDEFRAADGFAMQADLSSALPHLKRIDAHDLSGERRASFECMRDRFVVRKPVSISDDVDTWTKQVIVAYRAFWTETMLHAATPEHGEASLAAQLARLSSGAKHRRTPPMEVIEKELKTQLEARGYHALFGVTAPLREFMLWRVQDDRTYDVDLPGGREAVHVSMLDGFISFGWLGFATCDYLHNGGWATPERLFAVHTDYDLESEAFRVSYLAHEGQHFADYRRFPGLEQPELEYRAKLVEIATAQTTLYDLLADFQQATGANRSTPHPWANAQLITNLGINVLDGVPPSVDAWKKVSSDRLHAAARQLLAEDTAQREASRQLSPH